MAKANTTAQTDLKALTLATMTVELVGTSDLILCSKARSYIRKEVWTQSHPKGDTVPEYLDQPYNMWEKLITSINWMNPITFHDEDYSLYSEEEWKQYMAENTPFIFGKGFKDSFAEAFKSCGYKKKTGKDASDVKRVWNIRLKNPVQFASVTYDQHLVPSKSQGNPNVLSTQNVFSGWTCEMEITYLPSEFPKETVLEVIRATGKFIGIGSRRGEGYGRYTIGTVDYEEGMY